MVAGHGFPEVLGTRTLRPEASYVVHAGEVVVSFGKIVVAGSGAAVGAGEGAVIGYCNGVRPSGPNPKGNPAVLCDEHAPGVVV